MKKAAGYLRRPFFILAAPDLQIGAQPVGNLQIPGKFARMPLFDYLK